MKKGFTIIEVLLALSIFSVIITLTSKGIMDFVSTEKKEQRRVVEKKEVDEIVNIIRENLIKAKKTNLSVEGKKEEAIEIVLLKEVKGAAPLFVPEIKEEKIRVNTDRNLVLKLEKYDPFRNLEDTLKYEDMKLVFTLLNRTLSRKETISVTLIKYNKDKSKKFKITNTYVIGGAL